MPNSNTNIKNCTVTFEKIRLIYKETAIESAIKRREKQISDLPAGAVTLSFGSLNLRERKLTSLDGLESLPELKTLYIQDNFLKDLRHLNQPTLESLHIERNDIRNFIGCHRQPKLRSVHLDGNPIENVDLFALTCW